MAKSWLYVILGGFLEIFWVLTLKLSHNFLVLKYSVATVVLVVISFYLFSKGMKDLPSGVAYTVYTGIGAVGTIFFGIIFLHESISLPKIAFSILLIIGILGLKMSTEE